MARISRLAAILLLICSAPVQSAPSATEKLMESAERNLTEWTRWSGSVSSAGVAQLSDESRAALYRIHSQTQRSVRALTIAARDDFSRQFAAGYQEFAAALRNLHRAVVLGHDASNDLAQSLAEAAELMAMIKDIETPTAQRESGAAPRETSLSD
ncbi:MAG: hypothetical protein RLY56_1398 [Pseudomonadota bacterium]|jgi:hypothetical protein